MAKYQQYEQYKESGVEWLGFIPKDWNIVKVKNQFDVFNGSTPKSGEVEYWEGNIVWVTPSDLSQLEGYKILESSRNITTKGLHSCGTSLVPKGSMILSCRAPIGSLAVAGTELCTNQGCKTLVPISGIPVEYYYYYFSTVTNVLNNLGRGSTFLELSTEDLTNLAMPLPSISESYSVVEFLDHETTQIDTLIEKQQTLIQLLKEKRQAVISHAVTKGLNPDVPMKESGVEWLGDVPEHWEVTKAKYVSDIFIPQRNKPELNAIEGCPWVTMEDMKSQYIDEVHRYVKSEAMQESGSKVLKAGAVIASCVGNFGVTSINRVDVIINQQLQAFQAKRIKPEYLQAIVALSKSYFELIGTAATLIYVNREGFENLPVIVPTTQEQEAISKFINIKSKQFDLLVSKAEQAIQLMQERRTALISAAVTGKIDVRGWRAPDVNIL